MSESDQLRAGMAIECRREAAAYEKLAHRFPHIGHVMIAQGAFMLRIARRLEAKISACQDFSVSDFDLSRGLGLGQQTASESHPPRNLQVGVTPLLTAAPATAMFAPAKFPEVSDQRSEVGKAVLV